MSSHDNSWILDNGTSQHMISHKEWFSTLKPLEESIQVTVGNDTKCKKEGKGIISFQHNDGINKNLLNVLYVPDIKRNLLSILAITTKNYECILIKIQPMSLMKRII